MNEVFEEHPSKSYFISTNLEVFDFNKIHKWLSDEAYWSKGIPRDICIKSFENSFSFGLFHRNDFGQDQQVGCARFVTDYATFGYLADVYIDPDHRGLKLGDWLVTILMSQESIRGLRRCMLATSNMHRLYGKVGFAELKKPKIIMERVQPDIYER